MREKHPAIQRDETVRGVLIGGFVLVLAAIIFLSDRPLIIGDRTWVMPMAPLAAGSAPATYPQTLDDYGLHILKMRRRPLFAVRDERGPADMYVAERPDPLRFGYSIIETDVLGMPFVFRQQYGDAIYAETDHEFVIAPVTEDYLKETGIRAPGPLDSLGKPWGLFTWGWLFAAGLAGIGWFELGAARRRRDALGLI